MQRVAGLVGFDVCHQGPSEKREITDRIEDLVAHELVLETQLVVQHAALSDHNGVVEAAAAGQAIAAQHLHLPEESEGPRRGDRLGEGLGAHPARQRLVAQQRMVETDRVAHPKLIRRPKPHELASQHHLHGLDDLDVLPGYRVRPQPDLVDQEDERRGAAVENRQLRPIDLHEHVVHSERAERREQVLDRRNAHAVPAERRRVVGAAQLAECRGDLHPYIGPQEADTVLGGGRFELEANRLAGVEADPSATDPPSQRSPIGHRFTEPAAVGCNSHAAQRLAPNFLLILVF